MAEITEINIVPIKPNRGLVAFASCIYDNLFYFGSIAVYTRFDGGIRLVYPKTNGMDTYHPIIKEIGDEIEQEIEAEYLKLYG
jgi:DNA-binding cell septation regulator SpoVG